MKKFIQNIKNLPVKTKSLLGLGIVLALAVALPLFVWAVLTQRLDLRKRASSGEPSNLHPITWVTQDVSITADDFYVISNGKSYYGNDPEVIVIPGTIDTSNQWANIEIQSNKYGDDLRIKVYFKSDGSTWHVDSVGVLNSNYSNEWVSYNGPITPNTSLGQAYYQSGNDAFFVTDPNNGQQVAEVHFLNLIIQPFINVAPYSPPPTPSNPPSTGNDVVPTDPPVSQYRDFEIRLKLTGVNDDAAEGARVVFGFLSRSFPEYQTLVSAPVTLHYISNGIYQANFKVLANLLPSANDYVIYVKGEKHINRRYCHDTGQTQRCPASQAGSINIPQMAPNLETQVFDFTNLPLEPGDLYPQDGRADANDFNKIKDLMKKSCSSLTEQDKLTADLNYDGCVTVLDAFLMRRTLETRYDE